MKFFTEPKSNYIYFVYTLNENDSRPSPTGEYTYTTVSVCGVFSTKEKAIEAAEAWYVPNDKIIISERYIEDFGEHLEEIIYNPTFSIYDIIDTEDKDIKLQENAKLPNFYNNSFFTNIFPLNKIRNYIDEYDYVFDPDMNLEYNDIDDDDI